MADGTKSNEDMVMEVYAMLPQWAWILIACGLALILLLIIVGICCCCKKKKCCGRKGKGASSKVNKIDVEAVKALGQSYQEKIQPDLEDLKVDEAEKDEDVDMRLGRIHYSLDYDYQTNEVAITIIECTDLPAMDNDKTSDPYIKFFLYPDSKSYETKVINKSLSPVFNENFNIKIPYGELTTRTLTLEIYDYDRFSKHDQIGKVSLQLNTVDLGSVVEKWSYVQTPDSSSGGDSKLGDLCFSLRYVPTAGKLTVVVLEAKNLKKMDSMGLSDPYVKISLMSGSKRTKKKKTSVKKKTLTPYYNETFTFDVPFDQIQKTSLVLSVVDYDLIGKSDTIGRVSVGCNAVGIALKHWSDMLANPRRPIAQWHPLSEPLEEKKK